MGKQRDILEKLAGAFQIQHVLLRQALAECLGTLILVVSTEYFASLLQHAEWIIFVQVKKVNKLNC